MADEQKTRFTKIKFDGSKVRLEYQITKKDGTPDEYVISSSDQPDRAFPTALAALAADVAGICELPDTDQAKLSVRGVTLTYTNGIRGACITALKSLKTADAPLVLNTPHLPESPYGDNDAPTLALETIERLDVLVAEAARYLAGERAQARLILEPERESAASTSELVGAHA